MTPAPGNSPASCLPISIMLNKPTTLIVLILLFGVFNGSQFIYFQF
jgi:hypothetical protein